MYSNKPMRIGIAGFGIVGRRRYECLKKMYNETFLQVVSICDKEIKNLHELSSGVRCYENYQQLLTEDLDAVFVCLPNDIAPEVVIAGLQKGLHVFCEKPPGRYVSDIKAIIQEEKKHPHAKLMFGFNHRYHDSVQDALNLIKSKELGKIINLRGVYGKSKIVTFDQTNWRTKRAIAGGGVLLDQGIHMIDLMCLFAGDFKEIYSFVSNSHWQYDVEDNAYALMRTADGVVAMLNSSATQWRHRFNLDINLEKGSIILSGILSGSKSYGAETLTIVKADPFNDKGDPWEQTTRYNTDNSWEYEIKDFINSILKNDDIIYGSSYDALRAMELVYKIYSSDANWAREYNIQYAVE